MRRRITSEQTLTIRKLRRLGKSLSEIKEQVPVGYGSIFRRAKGVKILPQYWKAWEAKRGGSKIRKKDAEKKAADKAREVIRSLSDKQKIVFLVALYWGEGSKSDFGLSNTDPAFIRVFISGLKNSFGVMNEDLRISVRIFEDLDKQKCLEFWSKTTGIPIRDFISVNILRGRKTGKLKYGMCRVRLRKGGDMLKLFSALRREITKYFAPIA